MAPSTNKLSIYLIKPQYQQIEDIVEAHESPLVIANVGTFFYDESHPHEPDWLKDFFGGALGNNVRILSSSAKGILIVPLKVDNQQVHFAISFGVGRHLLRDGVF